MSKLLSLFAVMILSANIYGQSQGSLVEHPKFQITHVAVDIFPIGGEEVSRAQVAPEYSWKGKWRSVLASGYGFYEFRYKGGDFTNHSANLAWDKLPMVVLSMEQGGSSNGAFQQTGLRWVLHKTPKVNKVVGKAFNALQVSHYVKTVGTKAPNETLIGWATKPFDIKVGNIHSEGFVRLHKDRPDYGQPQFWFTPKKTKRFSFGCELEISGGRIGWQFGTRLWAKQ